MKSFQFSIEMPRPDDVIYSEHLPKGWKMETMETFPKVGYSYFLLKKDDLYVARIRFDTDSDLFLLNSCRYLEIKDAAERVVRRLNDSLRAERERQRSEMEKREGEEREKVLLAVLGEVPPESEDPATKDDPSEASADVEKKSSRFWPFVWLANAVVFLTILFVVSNWVF